MEQDSRNTELRPAPGGLFATTRWSVVLAADANSDSGRAALETLCQLYWFPVYALVRRRGHDPDAARDMTQEFFARILARNGLSRARQAQGRFRAFISQSVKNFLADQWDKTRAQKHGGGHVVLSLDAGDAEGRYLEMPHEITPDKLFDRQWAEQVLAAARARLQAEFAADGKGVLLDVLEQSGDPDALSLQEQADRLGFPLNTLKSHLHRARRRQGEIIRELIAETVSTPLEVEEELRQLLAALSG